jgi:predicted Zn-dependent protease
MNKNKNLLKCFLIPVILATNSCGIPKDLEYKYLLSKNDEKVIGLNSHKYFINKFGQEVIGKNLKKYVEEIKNNILLKTGNTKIVVKTFIFESKTFNAFTTMDGYIYLSTAILNLLTKDELYALICHEIAHIISRDNAEIHSLSILYKNLKVTRSKSNSIIVSKSTDKNIFFRKYIMKKRRENEYKADKIALELLSKAGYDKRFLILWLSKMEKYHKTITGPAKAFSTHPNIKDRIKRAELLIDKISRENASTKIPVVTE